MSIPKSCSNPAYPSSCRPQPLKLLALLASHASQVVTRDEIQKELWAGETFVDFEHGVNKCINQIRTALGDNADHPALYRNASSPRIPLHCACISKTIPAPQPKDDRVRLRRTEPSSSFNRRQDKASPRPAEVAVGQSSGDLCRRRKRQQSQPWSVAPTQTRDFDCREPAWSRSERRCYWLRSLAEDCTGASARQSTCAHRERHDRAGRLRQQDRRPGIRRHAEAGSGHSVGAIAIPRPGFPRQGESDIKADGPSR